LRDAIVEAFGTIESKRSTKKPGRIKRFRESSFVTALETLGIFGVLAAIGLFGFDMWERQEQAIARSWQLLTTSAPGNSGKVEALQYLNKKQLCIPLTDSCWKKRVPLRGIDLSPAANRGLVDLTGVDLFEADLRKANLSSVVLVDAKFRGANMDGVNMKASNLHGVDLTNAHADEADFSNADMTGSVLRNLHAEGSNFDGTRMDEIDATGADFAFGSFSDARISSVAPLKANFSGAILRGTFFQGSPLSNVDFTNADATKALFKEVDLSGAIFTSTNLSGSSFINDSGAVKETFKSAWAWGDAPVQVEDKDICLLSDLNIYNPDFWDPLWTGTPPRCAETGMTSVRQIAQCQFNNYRSDSRVEQIPSAKARIENPRSCK
jgi:uncharacterized protein YjbI with pentapeptide repeats